MAARRKAKMVYDPWEGMCAAHKPKMEWDCDYRVERGEHQEQCATCKRWLWPDERGPGFVSTGKSDTD